MQLLTTPNSSGPDKGLVLQFLRLLSKTNMSNTTRVGSSFAQDQGLRVRVGFRRTLFSLTSSLTSMLAPTLIIHD